MNNPAFPKMRHNHSELRRLALRLTAGGVVVEIGSFAGESTRLFLEAGLRVDAIDPWDNAVRSRLSEGAIDHDPNFAWQFEMATVEELFDKLLVEFPGRLTKKKGYDYEFVESYADGSVDAIYLDSIHSYEETRASIRRWRSKVRPGGAFCGHDFAVYYPGVQQAVRDEFGERFELFDDTSWLAPL